MYKKRLHYIRVHIEKSDTTFNKTMKNYIISAVSADKKLRRMALEVIERNYAEDELILVGIKENGLVIAQKISSYLKENYTGKINLVELVIDKKNPVTVKLSPDTDITGKVVVLIDDVANSGKTMLYALKPLLDMFPKKIQTMALVERTHKSFPIDLDYVGLSVSSTLDEHIVVEVENGEVAGAYI